MTNRRRYAGQQPGTKSGRRLAEKPGINRLSTAGFVPPSVNIGFCLFVLPKSRSGQLSSMPCKGTRYGCLLGERTCRPPVLLAPLRAAASPCAAPPRPARDMSGFWVRQD